MDPLQGDPRRGQRQALWLIVPLVVAFGLVLVVFYGLYRTTTVAGESMLPTLLPGDLVLVTRDYDTPARGDVVVLDTPDDARGDRDLVKRVIAVPGDTVAIENDVATVNGRSEDVSRVIVDPAAGVDVSAVRIPPGSVFLLGDNRPISYDSRFFGVVPLVDVRGKVVAVFAPVTRIRAIH